MTCNSKLYAIGGYDGTCNLSSVEFYDPEANQWTMCAKMNAHEGVVGVGVLPHDIDSNNNSTKETNEHYSLTSSYTQPPSYNKAVNGSSVQISLAATAGSVAKPFINYYSLMEEEEEESQFQSIIRQNTINFLAN